MYSVYTYMCRNTHLHACAHTHTHRTYINTYVHYTPSSKLAHRWKSQMSMHVVTAELSFHFRKFSSSLHGPSWQLLLVKNPPREASASNSITHLTIHSGPTFVGHLDWTHLERSGGLFTKGDSGTRSDSSDWCFWCLSFFFGKTTCDIYIYMCVTLLFHTVSFFSE